MLYRDTLLAGYRVNVMSTKKQAVTTKAKKLKKPGVVEKGHRIMIAALLKGTWRAGEKLPTESELRVIMGGVSRWCVREVLKPLRRAGAVRTVDGVASWVTDDFEPHMLRGDPNNVIRLSRKEFHDMLEFRQNVELICVELAASRATPDDIADIGRALDAMMANKHDHRLYSIADCEFHFAVMQAAHNTVFTKALNAIQGEYQAYLEELNAVEISTESIVAHGQLYQALKNHNSAAAVEAMKEILTLAETAITVVDANKEKDETAGTSTVLLSE